MTDVDPVLLRARGIHKHFSVGGPLARGSETVRAVDGVDLDVRASETLGLVGESGCGKSTLARVLLRLLDPTEGTLEFDGEDITRLGRRALRSVRREMQIVFQDPSASLNPRRKVGASIALPLRIHDAGSRVEIGERVRELLGLVGMAPEYAERYPHELSGGQRQRIGIARALALRPKLVVCDEPVSALDVSIQAQVVNLLADLQDTLGVAYLFVAHDLSVVRQVSHRIAVMYLGAIVELGPAEDVCARPVHPYTEALLSAVPVPDPDRPRRDRIVLSGDPPSPVHPPPACRFHTRCPHATEICRTQAPPLVEHRQGHEAACHHPRNRDA